jgi:hypothetical protein
MPHSHASVPPEAIRIEDEVWQEAFTRREPARPRPTSRLRAIDHGHRAAAPARPASRPAATQASRPAATQGSRPAAPVAPRPARTAAPSTASAPHQPGTALAGRRTVTIRGYGAERNLPWPDHSRRRPARRPYERAGFKPDRVALWAVFLGILLVLVAVLSAHS